MIRSATQQQQKPMFLRPIHDPNCSRCSKPQIVQTDPPSRLVFCPFFPERKEVGFLHIFFPNWMAGQQKTTFGAKYQQQRRLIKATEMLSCSEQLNNFRSGDQKSRIWRDDQFSERARRSAQWNAQCANERPSPNTNACGNGDGICLPTADQPINGWPLINHPCCAAERRKPVTAEKELMKN